MSKALPEIDFRYLSEIHADRPEFVTLYLHTPDAIIERTFIENRQREIMNALGPHPDLKTTFTREMERVVEEIEKRGTRGESLVVIACLAQGIFQYHELPLAVENMLILDSSPYIRPLAYLYEEYEHFLIVMVDHNNGVIHSVAGTIADTESIHKDIMQHHRKGGWSQMRYQRIREGNILHLFKEIAEMTETIARNEKVNRVVLAGPKEAKKQFYDQLSKAVQEMVIGYADISMKASYDEILDEAYQIFFREEQKEEAENMERLRSEIFKGGLASVGPADTIRALKEGRVHILIMDPNSRGGGWKCEKCDIWSTGSKEKCPECAAPIFPVDVYEEAVEEAKKMRSEIEFVKDDDFLISLGGMASVLRW